MHRFWGATVMGMFGRCPNHGDLERLDNPCHSQIYPKGLLRETAMTIALLFPPIETRRRSWLWHKRRQADLDVELGLARNIDRHLDAFDYWHDRLAMLQAEFDQTTPNRLSQWFYDRRDGNRFFTFWLAMTAVILTLLFGLIQSITGILQLVLH